MNSQAIVDKIDHVQNIVNEILEVEVRIHDEAPVSGVIFISSIGRERYVYWVLYNRRFRSRILSSNMVLIERLIPQNAQKNE